MKTDTALSHAAGDPAARTAPPAPRAPHAPAPTDLFTGWSPEEVDLVRRTIAPGADDYELALYLRLCRAYGLDPFRRELVMQFRDSMGRRVPVFIATRDAYLKVAMRDRDYRGLISGVVCEGDHFEIDAENFKVHHRFGATRGQILGAWAIAYHAKRPPCVSYVPFRDYFDPASPTWKRYPTAMIQKVAEVFVLRRQFNITGMVAREEIEREFPDAADTTSQEIALPTQPLLPTADSPASPPPAAADAHSTASPAQHTQMSPPAASAAPAHETTPQQTLEPHPAPSPEPATAAEDPRPAPEPAALRTRAAPQSTPLSRDEIATRSSLLARAARLAGYRGHGFVRAWLRDTYGLDVASAADIPEDMILRIIADAAALMEDAAQRSHTAPQAQTSAPQPAQESAPPAPQDADTDPPASPEQIARILQAFQNAGMPETEHVMWLRTTLRDIHIRSIHDLTASQAERVIRALVYLMPRSQRTGPPA